MNGELIPRASRGLWAAHTARDLIYIARTSLDFFFFFSCWLKITQTSPLTFRGPSTKPHYGHSGWSTDNIPWIASLSLSLSPLFFSTFLSSSLHATKHCPAMYLPFPSPCIEISTAYQTRCAVHTPALLTISPLVPRLRSRWLPSFSYLAAFLPPSSVWLANRLLSSLYGISGLACWSRLASDQRGVMSK